MKKFLSYLIILYCILGCDPNPGFKPNISKNLNDIIEIDTSNILQPEIFKWHIDVGSKCGPIYFLDEVYSTNNFSDSTLIQVVPNEITYCIIKIQGIEETLYLQDAESNFDRNKISSVGFQESEIAVFSNGEVTITLIIKNKIDFQYYIGVLEIIKQKRKSVFKIRGGLIC